MMKETLYQQVMNGVLEKIGSGFWKANDMISTEMELEKEYGVSNITVRRALKELEHSGVIYRVKGKGSFVCKNASDESAPEPGQAPAAKIITVIVPFDSGTSAAGDILRGLTGLFSGSEYILNCVNSQFDLEKEREMLLSYQAISSGIIFYPISSNGNVDVLCDLKAKDYPIVLIDKKVCSLSLCLVESQNENGACTAVRYLIEKGHTRIGFFNDSAVELSSSIVARYYGYIRALFEAGLKLDEKIVIQNFEKTAMEEMPEAYRDLRENRSLTNTKKDFYIHLIKKLKENGATAVFCAHDSLAAEVVRYAREAGVNIPQELSIVGFDDDRIAKHLSVPLTTVRQDICQIGYRAGMILKNFLELNTPVICRTVSLSTELIERASVMERK